MHSPLFYIIDRMETAHTMAMKNGLVRVFGIGVMCIIIAFSCAAVSGAAREMTYFTLYYGDKKVVVSDKVLSTSWYFEETKHEFTKGKSLYQQAEALSWKTGTETDIVQNHFPQIWNIVMRLKKETNRTANDGKINFDPDRQPKFWITGREYGYVVDIGRLCADILAALKSKKHADIMVNVKKIEPKAEVEILSKIVERSWFSTNFEDNQPRECNITLALEAFDGMIIEKGEVVSFNEVVGRRTRARGYQEAKIIIDGEFVPGVGGGVCQASTTLFNAVLLAGLKIRESHNHSLPISYVPLGRDAMVSSSADFEFQNTSGEKLYIEAKVIDKGPAGNMAFVKIYGPYTPIKYTPRVEIDYHDIREEVEGETPQIKFGIDQVSGQFFRYEKKVLDKGTAAKDVYTYLDAYKNGQLVNSKLVRKSKYKGKPRVVTYEKATESIINYGL